MENKFQAIDDYISICNSITESESENSWDGVDQTVPQCHIKSEDIDMTQFIHPEESYNMNYMFQKDGNHGCTFVPEMTDTYMVREDSNKHLLDLDQVFYENTQDFKQIPENTEVIEDPQALLMENENYQNLEKMLISQVKRDISEAASGLGISVDPTHWNVQAVNKWIEYTCLKFELEKPSMIYFQMNGVSLCMLSEYDFVCKSPESGSNLYNQLVIWKNACKVDVSSSIPTMVNSYSTDFCENYYPEQCVSPTPSLESSDSSQSSSQFSLDESFTSKGRSKSSQNVPRSHEHKQTIHLWQFLRELLNKPETFSHCIKWQDKTKGIFKIEDSSFVAKEWGRRKNRPAMNYDKLSRSIRQYYRKGIIKKTSTSKRLVYQFLPKYL